MPTTKSGGSKRGFAAMDPAKQREIASKGGKASHGAGADPAPAAKPARYELRASAGAYPPRRRSSIFEQPAGRG